MSDSNEKNGSYYLDCPFSEKDEVKKLGAMFDRVSKKWYVPPELYAMMYLFNRWSPSPNKICKLPRIYLNCPFSEKDEAKSAGAKWDPQCKAWYAAAGKKEGIGLENFSRWLPTEQVKNTDLFSPAAASKPVKSSQSSTSRGNAFDATTLRISDSMTVGQLQEECRLRGIRGLSGKNKDWLLDQLQVGSIWQSMSMKQAASTSATSSSSTKSQAKGNKTTKETAKKKSQVTKVMNSTEKRATTPAKQTKKKAAPTAKSTNAKPQKASVKPADLSLLPRITLDLTVSQLLHELLHRQPETKGTSSKTKAWFMEQLGEQSVWSTSPDLINQDYLTHLPVVSSSLTNAQLTHELLSRAGTGRNVNPNLTKGLSTKSKPDLLKLVGVGSIWTTGTTHTQGTQSTSSKVSPKKRKEAPSQNSGNKSKRTATSVAAKATTPARKKHAATTMQTSSSAKTSPKKKTVPAARNNKRLSMPVPAPRPVSGVNSLPPLSVSSAPIPTIIYKEQPNYKAARKSKMRRVVVLDQTKEQKRVKVEKGEEKVTFWV